MQRRLYPAVDSKESSRFPSFEFVYSVLLCGQTLNLQFLRFIPGHCACVAVNTDGSAEITLKNEKYKQSRKREIFEGLVKVGSPLLSAPPRKEGLHHETSSHRM